MRPIPFLLLCLAVPACAWGQQVPASHPSTRVAYQTVPDTVSGAKLPRLADARTPQTRAVNRRLDSISAELRCLDRMDRFGRKTEHWSVAETMYAADDVFSVHVRFGGFCGGAHPINGVNLSATFDLRTGKPVPFRELFADYEGDAQAIARALFPALTTAADRLSPAQVHQAGQESEEFCQQFYTTEELARGYFAYTFSDSGVMVEPDFPHVVRACQEAAVVPYERLRPFAAPGGILARVAAARSPSSAAAP
jgi:hypothetical protein